MYLSLQDGESTLMVASSRGHFEIVKQLLDKGAEVNHHDKVSYSCIVVVMFACMYEMACDVCTGCWHWDLFKYGLYAQCIYTLYSYCTCPQG